MCFEDVTINKLNIDLNMIITQLHDIIIVFKSILSLLIIRCSKHTFVNLNVILL